MRPIPEWRCTWLYQGKKPRPQERDGERGIQALMAAERDVHVGAARFERTGVRRTQRNGYKPRTLITRVGTLELRVPQTRDGRF